jgi:hypothetical protein
LDPLAPAKKRKEPDEPSSSEPLLMTVDPRYVLAPLRVTVPAPCLKRRVALTVLLFVLTIAALKTVFPSPLMPRSRVPLPGFPVSNVAPLTLMVTPLPAESVLPELPDIEPPLVKVNVVLLEPGPSMIMSPGTWTLSMV